MTNTWDSANRLIATLKQTVTLVNHYDGLGNRVGQTQDGVRIDYALDVAIGLPEVLYTSEGHNYLHLPGLIMTESDIGEVRYLLSDGLGSVRHVVDEAGAVVAYREYSPYGEPVGESETGYGFTGEWWESDIGLLHLRARWYSPEHGVFLSRDVVEGEPAYQYVRGNVVNLVDPSGYCGLYGSGNPTIMLNDPCMGTGGGSAGGALLIVGGAILAGELIKETGEAIQDTMEQYPISVPEFGSQPGFTLEASDPYHYETPLLAVPPLELTFPLELQKQVECIDEFPSLELPNILTSDIQWVSPHSIQHPSWNPPDVQHKLEQARRNLAAGFDPNHPIGVVIEADGTMIAVQGNHRLHVAKELGLNEVPVRILQNNQK